MRRTGLPLTRLNQHDSFPVVIFKSTRRFGQVKCATTRANHAACVFMMNPLSVHRDFDSPATTRTSRHALELVLSCRRFVIAAVILAAALSPYKVGTPAEGFSEAPHPIRNCKRSNPDVAKSHGRPYRSCLAPRHRGVARPKGHHRAGADHGSASRRACVAGAARQAPRAESHRFDLRQPDAVRADGGFRFLPAHLEIRRRQTRRREGRPDLESGRQGDVPGRLRHPDRARGSGHRRSRGSLPAAFLRRRRHRGRQAVHPVPAGRCDLRREGFSAVAGGDADGAPISTSASR